MMPGNKSQNFHFVSVSDCFFIGIEKITEQETAHPSLQQLSQLTGAAASGANGTLENITVSHEIEERAVALVDDDDDEEDSEKADKEHIDEAAFQSEPVSVALAQATVSLSSTTN